MTRKQMKAKARKILKKHYLLLLLVCLLAAFLGSEFAGSLVYFTPKKQESETEVTEKNSLDTALQEAIFGNEEEGRRIAGELVEKEQEKEVNPSLGRSRGVLARLVNEVSSGSALVLIALAIHSISGSGTLTAVVLILCSLVFRFFCWFFLTNMYVVISRRIFLEARCYEKMHLQRGLFLFKARKWGKASKTLFVCWGLQTLWSLTIVGGVIKRYSYYMVPYIVAENPDIDPLKAITLSRHMMKGHKWECFLFELSFLGWKLLGSFSLGLSAVFYSNPYKVASFCEYYTKLRSLALENKIPGAELFNDPYLFQKASSEVLAQAYGDVILGTGETKKMAEERGIRPFLGEWFSIAFEGWEPEERYDEQEARLARSGNLIDAARGLSYPARLFSIPESHEGDPLAHFHYMRHYSLWNLILLFFIFSVGGWIWEVSYHLLTSGELVKRGVLHGPWLPIYGSGAVLILTLLSKLRKNPTAEFFGTMALCSLIEYGTAFILEKTHDGTRWWDYTGYFLNLHGRICAEGILLFGLGGAAIVYVLAPFLDDRLRKISLRLRKWFCIVLIGCFLLDTGYSLGHPNTGEGITDSPPEVESTLLGPVHMIEEKGSCSVHV